MKNFLDKIRTPDKTLKTSKKIINTILILFLGTMTVLYTKPKNSIYSLLFTIVITLIYSLRLYIIQITIYINVKKL